MPAADARPGAGAKKKRALSPEKQAEQLCKKAEKAREASDDDKNLKLLEKAIALDPECDDAVWWLGDYWHFNGKPKLALEYFQRYLELVPDDDEAIHMIASLGGRKAPKRASDGFVRDHFGVFAEHFDQTLVKDLKYQVPKLLYRAVRDVRGRSAPPMDILDLGCGTGLVGEKFSKVAGRLVGVDLAPEMAKAARKRDVYSAVAVSEVTKYLRKTNATFDLVTAADVLIYIGDLEPLFRGARRVLRSGGLFALSAESQKSGTFKLTKSGRYVHSLAYLMRMAHQAGFTESTCGYERLRFELGKPVMGHIVVYAKDGDD
jgi:predicted TPR repeat methyltransferase